MTRAFQQVRTIYFALVGAVLIYIGVALLLRQFEVMPVGGFAELSQTEHTIMRLAFGLAAALQVGLLFTVVTPQPERARRRVQNAPDRASAIFNYYRGILIARWALAETIAIFGFVLFLLNGNGLDLLAFGGGSLVLMLAIAPSLAAFQSFAAQV